MSMDNKNYSTWSLQMRISNLLQKESTSDVEFLVGTPPKRFFGHKIILAAGSVVFETMFFGAIKQKSPVRVPDVTANGFDLMLQFLYSDKVSIQDESDAFEVAYTSKKYMIKSLFNICENFLLNTLSLTPDNVFTTHEDATFLEMTNIQDYCLRYVSRNAKKIFHTKSFTKISRDTFQDILKLDLMNIESEMEIIEALWLWGEEQCKENGIKCTVENVRKCTKAFLKHIRFFALTMDELVNILEKCQILDTSEEMALLWNVAMPRARKPIKVPPNICTESRTRSISNSAKIRFPAKYIYDGSMTAFLIKNYQKKVEITVTGSPIIIIGVLVAFKPIACYSCHDRSLEIEIFATNCSSAIQSRVKSRFRAEASNGKEEEQHLVLLDEYIVIGEDEVGTLTVIVTGEGIRLMQCTEEEFSCNLGQSEVCLKFEKGGEKSKLLFPIKELMLAEHKTSESY